MNHSVCSQTGIGVAGDARSFATTALIDADIDDHRTVFHLLHHIFGENAGSSAAFSAQCANHHIGIDDGIFEHGRLNDRCIKPRSEIVLQAAQAIDCVVENLDAGSERSEEHTSELQSRENLVCRLLLEKKKKI